MEEDEQDTIEALQSGHSRSTENRIYGLSMDALSGASEDILPFFLDSSTDWHKVCKVVPGGLAIPYQQAQSKHFEALKLSKAFTLGNTPSFSSSSNNNSSHPILDTDALVHQVIAKMEPLFANLANQLVQQLQPTLQDIAKKTVQQTISTRSTSPHQWIDDNLDYLTRELPPPTTPSEPLDPEDILGK